MVGTDGDPTCKTKEGLLCTGCCTALRITEKGQPNIVLKEAGQNCGAQIPTKGCRYKLEEDIQKRYWVCPKYHCSHDIAKLNNPALPEDQRRAASHRLAMENSAALMHGEIAQHTFKENLYRLPSP
jgi:hypothetical protein